MRQRVLTPVAVLAALTAGAGLSGCGSSGGIGGGTDAGGGRMTTPTSAGGPPDSRTANATSAAAAASSASAQNRVDIHVTGGLSLDATGSAGTCAYYNPDTHTGVNDSVTSSQLPSATGDAGTWALHIQDNTGKNPSVFLTTSKGSWTSGSTVDGTLTADKALKGATFDLTLTQVPGQQKAHLKGSITCS